LFKSLGVQITRATERVRVPTRTGGRLATFVGFGGNELRGAITMDLPIELVAQLHPSPARRSEIEKMNKGLAPGWQFQEDLCDWAGELANQLLGRMKNGLARHGVALQMSTPSTVWGDMVHPKKLRKDGSLELTFASGEHLILIYFDGVALVPLDLTQAPKANVDEPLAEGDMIILRWNSSWFWGPGDEPLQKNQVAAGRALLRWVFRRTAARASAVLAWDKDSASTHCLAKSSGYLDERTVLSDGESGSAQRAIDHRDGIRKIQLTVCHDSIPLRSIVVEPLRLPDLSNRHGVHRPPRVGEWGELFVPAIPKSPAVPSPPGRATSRAPRERRS
jgi:chemotaxis protein CheX